MSYLNICTVFIGSWKTNATFKKYVLTKFCNWQCLSASNGLWENRQFHLFWNVCHIGPTSDVHPYFTKMVINCIGNTLENHSVYQNNSLRICLITAAKFWYLNKEPIIIIYITLLTVSNILLALGLTHREKDMTNRCCIFFEIR